MKNRGGRKNVRGVNVREGAPVSCLILTEGEETEVNYFKNIRSIINKRFREKIIVENFHMDIKGAGRSTSVLVREAIKKKNRGMYSEVWVVFDKDNNTDFSEAITLARKNEINVAWSNESFELWFVLHFQNLNSAVDRNSYVTILNKHFKNEGINNGKYEKNIKNIFDITKNNVDNAISRSEKLIKQYGDNNIVDPEKMNPATTIHEIVKELLPYLR